MRGVIMLKTACSTRLLSCNETTTNPANAAASIAAIPIPTAIPTAIAIGIGIVAVNAHVPIQVARLRESMQNTKSLGLATISSISSRLFQMCNLPEQAQLALIRLLTAVDAQMLGQRGAVGEGLLAGGAAIGPLTGMGSHVRGDAGALREASITNGTPERLLPRMCAYVSRQIGGLREAFVAVRTAIWPLPGMGA